MQAAHLRRLRRWRRLAMGVEEARSRAAHPRGCAIAQGVTIRSARCATWSSCRVTTTSIITLAVQIIEKRQEFFAGPEVERAGRLVVSSRLRIVDQAQGNGGALLLPASSSGGRRGRPAPRAATPRPRAAPTGVRTRPHRRAAVAPEAPGEGAGKRVEIRNTKPISRLRRSAMRLRLRRLTSSPRIRWLPLVERSSRPIIFISVLLPEPLAPTITRVFTLADGKRYAAQRMDLGLSHEIGLG